MDNYLSVSQVNNYIKGIFDNEILLKNICVYGEVSSYNVSNNIAYFNIKDQDNLLNCVLFGANKFTAPALGDMVLITGSMSYYTKGGRLSFNATSIAPYGKGLLYEKFLQLKAKLEALGYFDIARKKPIPPRVKRIGVVTSSTGAVIQDIIDVTTRRNDTIDIVLYPVKVQGVGAEFEIANGINFFSEYEHVDVVIVARGGGSLEDLQPFNTEEVAVATFNCKKPIVSAVGHETDFTIIDFVSDLRAPTPSAAAELVAWDKRKQIQELLAMLSRMYYAMQTKTKLIASDIDKNIYVMSTTLKKQLNNSENSIANYLNKIYTSVSTKLLKSENIVAVMDNSISKLNPANIVKRGFAKVMMNNSAITSVENINVNDSLVVELIDGKVKTSVNKVIKKV